MKTRVIAFIFLIIGSVSQGASVVSTEPSSMGILAPYVGRISNSYSNPGYRLNIDEAGTMAGLYGQWLHPKYFQANAFFYHAPKAQMTNLTGLHLNFDYYSLETSFAKLVTGIDLEIIRIHTAGAFTGVEAFEMNNNVGTAMPRLGLSVPLYSQNGTAVSVFPYVGVTYESVTGDVSVDPQGSAPSRTSVLSDSATYGSLGFNLSLRFAHFVEVHAKYLGGLKREGRSDAYTGLLNLYLTREMALSYRFKHMELAQRSNQYHLLGLAFIL